MKRWFSVFQRSSPKWDLAIVAIFKNESVAITEWMEHYLKQGVGHFFLIDNGSTDDCCEKLDPYIQKGLVTLVHDSTRWAQKELYNQYFLEKRHLCKWLMVCDLDEFAYSRKGFQTIIEYLNSLPEKVHGIKIPWKMFGSAGYEVQPDAIVKSFTKRSHYDGRQHEGMRDGQLSLCKMIARGSAIRQLNLHEFQLKLGAQVIDPNGTFLKSGERNFVPVSEALLENASLHLNHYALQSKEWFLAVKGTRGAADGQSSENIRDEAYFNRYDRNMNEVEDRELAGMHASTARL